MAPDPPQLRHRVTSRPRTPRPRRGTLCHSQRCHTAGSAATVTSPAAPSPTPRSVQPNFQRDPLGNDPHLDSIGLRNSQEPEPQRPTLQAEAEREKRAKIIAAEGEALAAAALGEASDTMMAHPLALQLRNLQTLVEIAVGKNLTGLP